MPYLSISLENGHKWTLTGSEVTVPSRSLQEMSPGEIGKQMAALAPVLEEFQQYLRTRHERDWFDSLEDFRAEAAANSRRLQQKQVRHSQSNRVWQIDYQVYSVEDLQRMLDQDQWSHIFRPGVRMAMEALVTHPESWQDAARAVGLSVGTLRERVHNAVHEYSRWKATVGRPPRKGAAKGEPA